MKYVATLNGKKYEIEIERVDGRMPLDRGAAAVAAAAAPAPAIDEEAYAVLVAAVTEEARLSGDGDVRVVSIKEL